MTISREQLRLAHSETTREVIGAFYAVYNALGSGFLKSVYAAAMEIELSDRGVGFRREQAFAVYYKGRSVGDFRSDFVVVNAVLVELKAVDRLVDSHAAQLINYLSASKLTIGLLLNFGPKATFRRLVHTGPGVARI